MSLVTSTVADMFIEIAQGARSMAPNAGGTLSVSTIYAKQLNPHFASDENPSLNGDLSFLDLASGTRGQKAKVR